MAKVRIRIRQAAAQEVSGRGCVRHFSTTDTGSPSPPRAGGEQSSGPQGLLTRGPQSSLRRELSVSLFGNRSKPDPKCGSAPRPQSPPPESPSCRFARPFLLPLLSNAAQWAHIGEDPTAEEPGQIQVFLPGADPVVRPCLDPRPPRSAMLGSFSAIACPRLSRGKSSTNRLLPRKPQPYTLAFKNHGHVTRK